MAKNECDYLNTCSMFKHFVSNSELLQVFIKNYCKGNFEKCERKKIRDTGKMPPDNLLPNGKQMK